jgi:protein TonB
MFSDLAVPHGSHVRRWTALASFTLQAALVAIALVYPLLHTPSLPWVVRTLLPPIATTAGPIRPEANSSHSGGPTIHPIIVSTHSYLTSRLTPATGDTIVTQPPDITGIGMIGDRYQEGVEHSIMGDHVRPLPKPPVATHTLRQSVMMEGNLIHKVEPQYPPFAKQLHIQGTVVVKAFISREGVITHAEAESGQPLLVAAALDAVRQWRYRPYYLNHELIEVETEITVNFVLGH